MAQVFMQLSQTSPRAPGEDRRSTGWPTGQDGKSMLLIGNSSQLDDISLMTKFLTNGNFAVASHHVHLTDLAAPRFLSSSASDCAKDLNNPARDLRVSVERCDAFTVSSERWVCSCFFYRIQYKYNSITWSEREREREKKISSQNTNCRCAASFQTEEPFVVTVI